MKKITAYKVFNSDWTCRGFKYKVGKSYSMKEKPLLCNVGFHACVNLVDCFNYYDFNPDNKVAIVEMSGDIVDGNGDKIASNRIKIVREISWSDVLTMVNTGKGNSGISNSGDRNSGSRNSGYRNSGDWNSSDCNSGSRNSGDWNSGDWNSSDCNSGSRNSGDWNSGNSNSGNRNSGNRNSGNRNSGNRNSGDWNSGDWNSGDWNSGDWNSGYFNNSTEETIRVFGVYVSKKLFDSWHKPGFLYFNFNEWVEEGSMTDEEKQQHKTFYVCGGYLKTLEYKEAFKESFDKASLEDRNKMWSCPNFNAEIFYDISGIDWYLDENNNPNKK